MYFQLYFVLSSGFLLFRLVYYTAWKRVERIKRMCTSEKLKRETSGGFRYIWEKISWARWYGREAMLRRGLTLIRRQTGRKREGERLVHNARSVCQELDLSFFFFSLISSFVFEISLFFIFLFSASCYIRARAHNFIPWSSDTSSLYVCVHICVLCFGNSWT